MAAILTPPDLLEAVTKLWHLPPPGPESLFSSHPFAHLRQTCERLYPCAGSGDALSFALHRALRAFGLPCGLPPDKQHLALLADDAAHHLAEAFRSTQTSRIHLCPFDCADTIPPLNFGPASVRKFSASELEALVNRPQLQRCYPSWEMDSQRLSSFTWLVVREEARLSGEPGQRAVPVLYESLDRDFGAIEPHQARFPGAVEAALFTLLLAPWEDWVLYTDFDWRAFRTPWVYTTDGDVFRHHPTPPSSDTLSWEPCIYMDQFGDEVESERPIQLPRSDSAADASTWINEASWTDVNSAEKALVFGGPVMHFLIRAFLSSGIDEFLAHITVIEAALGTQIDHDTRRRSKIKGGRQGATARVAMRLSALLGDKPHAADFLRLFNARSEFLHGRTTQTIAGSERVLARRLARRVAVELVRTAAQQPALPREVFLQRLLDAGQLL